MPNSSKKKTWVKRKNAVYNCGNCDWCGKALFSDMGGWIVNAEKSIFVIIVKITFVLTDI